MYVVSTFRSPLIRQIKKIFKNSSRNQFKSAKFERSRCMRVCVRVRQFKLIYMHKMRCGRAWIHHTWDVMHFYFLHPVVQRTFFRCLSLAWWFSMKIIKWKLSRWLPSILPHFNSLRCPFSLEMTSIDLYLFDHMQCAIDFPRTNESTITAHHTKWYLSLIISKVSSNIL